MSPSPQIRPLTIARVAHQGIQIVRLEQNAPLVLLSGVMTIGYEPNLNPFTATFSAALQWIVNHNLARRPMSVRVLTVGGVEVEAEVVDMTDNQCIVSFASAQAGRVIVF